MPASLAVRILLGVVIRAMSVRVQKNCLNGFNQPTANDGELVRIPLQICKRGFAKINHCLMGEIAHSHGMAR
jgi:hypothetical protein